MLAFRMRTMEIGLMVVPTAADGPNSRLPGRHKPSIPRRAWAVYKYEFAPSESRPLGFFVPPRESRPLSFNRSRESRPLCGTLEVAPVCECNSPCAHPWAPS
jgi:hypothetical protein